MDRALDQRALLADLPPQEIARLCGVSVSTAKRWASGKSRVPTPALRLIALHVQGTLPEETGRESPIVRAARLRARMLQFNDIYNAAWFIRMAQHGAPEYRRAKVERFVKVLRRDLATCRDEEALIYAVADALTAYPRGLPWES